MRQTDCDVVSHTGNEVRVSIRVVIVIHAGRRMTVVAQTAAAASSAAQHQPGQCFG